MSDPAYPDALPALSRLHWYVLERVLGQGAFGITYLAKDSNLDQRVAIKEYLPIDVATRMQDTTVRSRTDDLRDRYRWGLERFIQEARTLARFDHPNIVRVLSVFEFNGTAYMVMRFEEGGTLAALLDRRGTLPEPDLLRVLLPVLSGLELVHNAGFIHRDIKPDNIHIGSDGRPVLLDFGSARQSLGSLHSLTILVAPGYAPFEQYYSDPSSQGPWTDIYGLGATCYRAICGRSPLDAISRSKGILGSTQEVMTPASIVGAGHYSSRVLAAIDHALAFAEKDRPQTIAEWRTELTGGASAPMTSSGHAQRATPAQIAAAQAPTLIDAPSVRPAAEATAEYPPTGPSSPSSVVLQSIRASSRVPWWAQAAIVAAIAILAIAVYAILATRSDETENKIAVLEKQLKDNKAAADAQLERKAKQDEEDAKQRKAQEQSRAQEEKAPVEPARKPDVTVAPKPAAPKSRDEPATKRSPKNEAAASKPPSDAAPPSAAPTEPPRAQPAPLPPVTVAPEAEKTARPTPAELIAGADNAIKAQRYADAIAILKPLADAGNAQAQARLGDAYVEGRGVDRDFENGVRWYEKAALQGDTSAQMKLGAMYAKGQGVTQNNNLAYMWYGTAARLGSTVAKTERDRIAALLQPKEREQMDKLITNKIDGMKRP